MSRVAFTSKGHRPGWRCGEEARGSHVIANGVRPGFHVPRIPSPVVLALIACVAVVVAWALLTMRHTANRADYAPAPAFPLSSVKSVVYSVPRNGNDNIYLWGAAARGEPLLLASYPYSFNLHARGSTSPGADLVAVLHVEAGSGTYARLELIGAGSGRKTPVEAELDYLSPFAWSPDGGRLAMVRSSAVGVGGMVAATIVEVDTASGQVSEVARFDGVLEADPVGYTLDGEKLLIVVIDQSGSALWSLHGGSARQVARLSPGRTLSWALSPDSSRLAFIDVLGAGQPTYAGRTLIIATGRVVDTPSFDDQLGVAWMPGSEIPIFGGPGGSLRLTPDALDDGYVVPQRWSPDGSTLAATIFPARDGQAPERSESLELFLTNANLRIRLSDEPGSSFFGWVRNVE